MTGENKELKEAILEGRIDVNAQQIFFRTLIRALLTNLNSTVSVRDIDIPHMIVNTGDDKMYLAVKGQDISVEPGEVSNENYVYNVIPRCIVTPGTITLLFDQLTSPYARGTFSLDDGSNFNAEFRRMPLKMSFNLKYYFDSFTDALEATQSIISNFAVVKLFSFAYLGQKIECSYSIGDTYNIEKNLEFDGLSADAKYRTIEFDIEVESNFPIFYNRSVIENTEYIKEKTMIMTRTAGNPDVEANARDLVQYKINEEHHGGVTPKYKI